MWVTPWVTRGDVDHVLGTGRPPTGEGMGGRREPVIPTMTEDEDTPRLAGTVAREPGTVAPSVGILRSHPTVTCVSLVLVYHLGVPSQPQDPYP